MATNFLSKKVFSNMAGLSTRELAVYIKRGKVITEADGISPDHPTNKDFLDSRQKHKDSKKESKKHFEKMGELELSHKARQAEKLQTEIEILRAKKEKLTGELIPIQPVKDLVLAFSKNVVHSFRDLIGSKLAEHSKRLRINRNEVAELRQDFVNGINSSMEVARKNTLKDIKTISNSYGN